MRGGREGGDRNHASIFFDYWYHSQMAFTCSEQWKHEFLKYVEYAWKPMYKTCWKPTIKAQEWGDWSCSGVFIISFRGVGVQDLLEYLRWSFFCNSIDKSWTFLLGSLKLWTYFTLITWLGFGWVTRGYSSSFMSTFSTSDA